MAKLTIAIIALVVAIAASWVVYVCQYRRQNAHMTFIWFMLISFLAGLLL